MTGPRFLYWWMCGRCKNQGPSTNKPESCPRCDSPLELKIETYIKSA